MSDTKMSDNPNSPRDAKIAWLSTMLGVDMGRPATPGSVAEISGAQATGAQATGAQAPGAQAPGAQAPGAQAPGAPAPATPPLAMPTTGMKVEDIAAAIMDKQVAILVGWRTALQVFDKTMTSSADAEATPDFQKVVGKFFLDKVMGALLKHAPGAAELDEVVKALSAEAERAGAAGASAALRDFVVQHAQAAGKVEQSVLSHRQGFISAVRARRETAEAPPAIAHGHRGAPAAEAQSAQLRLDLGVLRINLLDAHDSVDKYLLSSTSELLFRALSEEWMRHATVTGGMGIKFPAAVVIRLNPNHSIKDAHIQGTGGQKIAEQLLKDSPSGVDVLNLKAPRRILLMADNGWPQAILSLDVNNRDTSTGSIAEGESDALYRYVMSKGLPLTKTLDGD